MQEIMLIFLGICGVGMVIAVLMLLWAWFMAPLTKGGFLLSIVSTLMKSVFSSETDTKTNAAAPITATAQGVRGRIRTSAQRLRERIQALDFDAAVDKYLRKPENQWPTITKTDTELNTNVNVPRGSGGSFAARGGGWRHRWGNVKGPNLTQAGVDAEALYDEHSAPKPKT